jgi:hypothetical protein
MPYSLGPDSEVGTSASEDTFESTTSVFSDVSILFKMDNMITLHKLTCDSVYHRGHRVTVS